MTDPDDALLWTFKPTAPTHTRRPAERLFDFTRRDGAPMTCILRFHGESYGWEVQFADARGREFYARGGFVLRELAVRWAERERDVMRRAVISGEL